MKMKLRQTIRVFLVAVSLLILPFLYVNCDDNFSSNNLPTSLGSQTPLLGGSDQLEEDFPGSDGEGSGDNISDDENPPPITQPPSSEKPIDLCKGLVQDQDARSMVSMGKPKLLSSFVDPAFGTTLRRITSTRSGGVIKPLYSTIQAWNADESLLLLYATSRSESPGHWIYDGETYEKLQKLAIDPSDIEEVHWDSQNPKLLYYLGGPSPGHKSLISLDVLSGNKTVVKDFSSYCSGSLQMTWGNDVQMGATEAQVFGFRCGSKSWITYHRIEEKVVVKNAPESSKYLAPQPGPSGTLFYADGQVYDFNLNVLRTLNLGNNSEHASFGSLSNGEDAYFAVSFNSSPKDCSGSNGVGSVVAHSLESGSCRVLVGPSNGYIYPPSGTHLSALSYKNKGWVAVSSVGSGGQLSLGSDLKPLISEIYLANSDPKNPKVCRVAHHRSWARNGQHGYFAEPHVTISPSGTRLLFASDWQDSDGVDTYVVELPSAQ